MRKKLLFILMLPALFIACSDDDNPQNPNLPKLSKWVTTNDKNAEESIIKFTYGSNGYLKKILETLIEVDDDGKILTSKFEKNYFYNSKEQLVKIKSFDYKGDVQVQSDSTIYIYDSKGFITSSIERNFSTSSDGTVHKSIETTNFQYNNGLMVKKINNDDTYIYEYNADGKIEKEYNERSSHIYTTYSFDTKNSPFANMLPKEILLINPDIASKNNLLVEEEENPAYDNYKTVYEYTYNDKQYPTTARENQYEGSTLKRTKTKTYTY